MNRFKAAFGAAPSSRRRRRALAAVATAFAAALAVIASMFVATSAAHAQVQTGVWYQLQARHSGLNLAIQGGSTATGAQLIQNTPGTAQSQQFRFIDAGGGYYRIQARHSNHVLDVYQRNADNGADIVQWTDNNGTNQQWRLQQSGEFYSVVNRFSGKALDVWERSTSPGARVSQYTANGGTNQQFRLIAADSGGGTHPGGGLEAIDRSPVAVAVSGGVYIGWRMLGTDPAGVAFNVYRNGQRLNAQPMSGTNYTDTGGNTSATYRVGVVVNGQETETTANFGVWAQQYIDINMSRPAGGTTPDGVAYTYSPNDASVADLTGDGKYELIQLWQPSNARDNAQSGHTGNVYIDAYTLTGQRLWRIDLGRNIRAGAHYTSLIAYDLDGDGRAEIALKTGDGTRDGQGTVIGNANADHRNSEGRILTGPEYLTVFDGRTGAARNTVAFRPERGNINDWGDNYGNRGDRLMAAVAYLDGQRPSLITSRGIYAKIVITAWDFNGSTLTRRWEFNSNNHSSAYRGQGNHQLSIADVDGDGRDEIIFGAMTIDDNGAPLYSSNLGHGDALHVGDFNPNRPGLEIFSPFESAGSNGNVGAAMRDARTGTRLWTMQTTTTSDVGRGACGDIDPRHVGAECWAVTVDGRWDSRRGQLRAADGTLISTTIPSANHMIWWDGTLQREILDHVFDEPNYVPVYPYIAKWNPQTSTQSEIFRPSGVHSNNGTKGNPVLTADLFGDWREEVIWRKADNSGVRIFTTIIPTEYRIPTLMHDRQYRLAIAWQNESYNQPPWPSFYIGQEMDRF